MERREGCRYGVRSSQDSLMDRAQGRVDGGMQADGHVSFWNHSLGWEPLEEKQDYRGGKGTESRTAVPSSR